MADLLLELFSEEIPARMQAQASADLQRLVTGGLVEAGLTYESAAAFATPRRLTLAITGLTSESPTLREERKGPRTDAPEAALEGFLRSTGLRRDQLIARDDKKGAIWFGTVEKQGRKAAPIIAEVVPAVIRSFPWPKSMRWGSGDLRWVRPLHSILCILSDQSGTETVPFSVDGIESANTTRGHRFMAPATLTVSGFDDYVAKLRKAYVVLDPAERADHISADAQNLTFARGLELVADDRLLAEVAGLVEWPVVLMGDIGSDFLHLPPEVLQTSMREHQKFFSARNPKTGRIEAFLTVANRETADNGAAILAGNGKVLAARLSDAKFFWENDLRTVAAVGLEGMGKPLEQVTFHNKLGSQAERVARIAALAREIAPMVGADPDLAEQAAKVAKADLCSEMVGEFPELQGLMGRYYATAAGLPAEVAAACQDHYSPLGPTDKVPTAPVSVAVALADKIDTLTGFWSIDEKPTGSKDPFALRRAALGVIRLVLERQIRLPLIRLFDKHQNRVLEQGQARRTAIANKSPGITLLSSGKALVDFDGAQVSANAPDLLSFLHDRLKVYLRDQGLRHDVLDACLAMPNSDDLTLLTARARALDAFLKTEDGTNLQQGYKRANNILTQAEAADGVEYSYGADPKFAESAEETALFTALDRTEASITPAMAAEDFTTAMAAMAALRAPLDAFFQAVQVNSDNSIIRRNRLNLLSRIRKIMAQVADFTKIEGA